MKIEDVEIEDAVDANYVIRKFFNDQLGNVKISQLEQLILTVYNMGKNKTASAGSESPVSESSPEIDEPEVNPFNVGDRAKALEDIEIGRSGNFIKTDTVGTINSVTGDKVSFLFESSEDGEMIEASVPFQKLEKNT